MHNKSLCVLLPLEKHFIIRWMESTQAVWHFKPPLFKRTIPLFGICDQLLNVPIIGQQLIMVSELPIALNGTQYRFVFYFPKNVARRTEPLRIVLT